MSFHNDATMTTCRGCRLLLFACEPQKPLERSQIGAWPMLVWFCWAPSVWVGSTFGPRVQMFSIGPSKSSARALAVSLGPQQQAAGSRHTSHADTDTNSGPQRVCPKPRPAASSCGRITWFPCVAHVMACYRRF